MGSKSPEADATVEPEQSAPGHVLHDAADVLEEFTAFVRAFAIMTGEGVRFGACRERTAYFLEHPLEMDNQEMFARFQAACAAAMARFDLISRSIAKTSGPAASA